MRGLLGLLSGIVLVLLAIFILGYAMQAVMVGAQTRLETARAERIEAQTMLQQAATIDYLARQQAAYSNRLFVGVAVMGLMVLGALAIALFAVADMTKEGIKGQQTGQGALAGTGRSLHDADEIIILRKDEGKENSVNMTWAKNREGRADCFVPLVRKPGFPVFVDAATGR